MNLMLAALHRCFSGPGGDALHATHRESALNLIKTLRVRVWEGRLKVCRAEDEIWVGSEVIV